MQTVPNFVLGIAGFRFWRRLYEICVHPSIDFFRLNYFRYCPKKIVAGKIARNHLERFLCRMFLPASCQQQGTRNQRTENLHNTMFPFLGCGGSIRFVKPHEKVNSERPTCRAWYSIHIKQPTVQVNFDGATRMWI